MALDRDLGVAFVHALGLAGDEGWETNAATGIRGLRLLRESDAFRRFVFTEANPRTFAVLRQNIADDPRATAILGDAARSGPEGGEFGYVDIDPYGSPLGFLPRAIAATRERGILGVTATDMMVLAGPQSSACRRIYGANPVRGRLGPEGALRLLLMAIAREARNAGRSVEPLLAYVGGHHVRAYVRLVPGSGAPPPIDVVDPGRWDGPPLPGRAPVGPLWLGPIVDPGVAARLSVPSTAAEPGPLRRFVEAAREDASLPAPFYYEPNLLARTLGLPRPPSVDRLIEALRADGHRAGRTHVRPEGVRTDAPRSVVEAAARRAASPA